MSNYAQDYMQATDNEKLLILRDLFNSSTCSKEDKTIILNEAQKIYNRLKGKGSKQFILNLMNKE